MSVSMAIKATGAVPVDRREGPGLRPRGRAGRRPFSRENAISAAAGRNSTAPTTSAQRYGPAAARDRPKMPAQSPGIKPPMRLPPNEARLSVAIRIENAFREQFREMYPGFDAVFPQEGRNLGERMRNAFVRLLTIEDVTGACLIGADAPELSR